MNIKPFFKNAWNEPRRFFFFLTLFCIAGLAVGYILETNTPHYYSFFSVRSFAVIGGACLAIGAIIGMLGFVLSWIPPIHRFFVSALQRRFFLLACLITVIALFYAEENWRGKHAWEKYKRNQESRGERFDLTSIAPPPVPDDQNFAMAPIWVEEISAVRGMDKAKNWYGEKVVALGHTNFVRRLEMLVELSGRGLDFTNSNGNWQSAEKFDLKLWQEYYRKLGTKTNFFPISSRSQTSAADVLLALSKYDSQIEDLRIAAQLPSSRFPLGYRDDNPAMIVLPHLGSLKQISIALQLRALAELESEQPDKALDDIKLILRLIESVRNEPLLISHLVRIANFHICLQPVWQGLAEQRWNDAQLRALDAEFSKLDFLADYDFSMRGERALSIGVIDYFRRTRDFEILDMADESELWESGNVLPLIIFQLSPSGWFEQNKISISQMNSKYLLPIVDLKGRFVSLSTLSSAKSALAKISVTPFTWFERLFLPALEKIPVKYAHAQSAADMARIAIALERHRLAQGSFSKTLDALVPQFMEKLPHDIINGKALNYRRTDDGQFILYSIGWNGTDDGGSVVLGPGKKTTSVDIKHGDWVWKYPAK